MSWNNYFLLTIFILLTSNGTSREINLSPYASWDQNGITLAGWANGTNGSSLSQLNLPAGISISRDDILYIADFFNHRVVVVHLYSIISNFAIGTGPGSGPSQFIQPHGVFATNTSLYVIDLGNRRVQKLSLNGSGPTTVPGLSELNSAYFLYVDNNANIYVSDTFNHRVLLLRSNSTNSEIVAGTGVNGSNNNQLDRPYGVYVNHFGTIYIADRYNHRIMIWLSGALSGIRAAGDGTDGTSSTQLNHPTQVIVDANEYMYISEGGNSRITRWAPNSTFGVCIAACTGTDGIASTQLHWPHSLAFDSNGSLYVNDRVNHRVQKFQILNYHISYNQPKISANATWHPCGITLANKSMIGGHPHGIFVDFDNTVFVASDSKSQILIWSDGNVSPTQTATVNLYVYTSLFVTVNGDIYFANANEIGRIDKWPKSSTRSVFVTKFSGNCSGLFIDLNDMLYCSIGLENRVIKVSLNSGTNTAISVAGTGRFGSAADELAEPWGIFVDINFNLYVADGANNRIQRFRPGQTIGEAVAGQRIPANLILNFPTDVILDADDFLYIVDNQNNRIIRSKDDKFQCIIGCTNNAGSGSDELQKPFAIQFDSYGNLYVADEFNDRIQKFILATNPCDPSKNSSSTKSDLQCNMSRTPCDILKLYSNGGICYSNDTIEFGYSCSCPLGFNVTECQFDHRPCKPNTCWNHGICSETSDTTFRCECDNGWEGIQCESMINFCQNVTCMNNGICEPSLLNYSCKCPSKIYSGRHCEISLRFITNLISFNTLMITHDYQENLVLDPGEYSFDLGRITFNKNDWIYLYYCRIYLVNLQEFKLFEDQNQSCFLNKSNLWEYNDSINSSLTIFAESLELNQTYQFMVEMINRQDSFIQSIGYLIVEIKNIQSPIIMISCVISTMCLLNDQFHYVNPNTQLALFSLCIGNCSSIENIEWNIYQGSINSSNKTVQWTSFTSMTSSWFYGLNTKNLTIKKKFFTDNNETVYWRFEVHYSIESEISKKEIDIEINKPPKNGSCSIDPSNGTTMTLFTINCSNWYDKDQIKDFTYYSSIKNSSDKIMLAHTIESIIELRLPASINQITTFDIVVHIRDKFHCVYEFHFPSINVLRDISIISNFINALQKSNNNLRNNIIFELLTSGNQNTVGQMITSISQLLNEINNQTIELAALNGIPSTSISITSLNNEIFNMDMNSLNDSIMIRLNEQINEHANVREYLMMFINNLSTNTPNDVKFQSSILAKLTETTNQLTRKTSSLASTKCNQLSQALKSIARKLSYEDIHLTATHLVECATNVFNGVNGVLQERVKILELDLIRTKEILDNCDKNYFECQNIFEEEIKLKTVNMYYQKQTINKIVNEMNEIISLITSSLNLHLNINQSIQINTSSVYYSLEKLSNTSLLNSSEINFPSNINETILVRRMIQPLSLGDNIPSYTNFSRSFSLSIFDENENEIKIKTKQIKFFIPRDPNLIIPKMFLQNVTLINKTNSLFNYHMIYLTKTNINLTFSIHFEIHPLNLNLSYLLIYKFNQKPQLNSMDNWTLFCPSDLNDDDIYIHFIDNNQTLNHQSIIYGIRELNLIEMNILCSNKILKPFDEPCHFSSNYEIRIYQSGCFYLDSNNQWQSNGLLVGSSTNHYKTQCISTHLTTFSNAFLFLSTPMNLNDLERSSTKGYRNKIDFQCKNDQLDEGIDDFKLNNSTQSTNIVKNLEMISFLTWYIAKLLIILYMLKLILDQNY